MKQEFNITTGKTGEAANQLLSIRVGEKHFGFSITNADTGELYKLVWCTDAEMDENGLDEIHRKHEELLQPFRQTLVCYDHPQSVLVPATQYREEDARLLLQAMFGFPGRGQVQQEAIPNWQLHNVYTVPREIKEWAGHHFSKARYLHAYSVGIAKMEPAGENGSLDIDFRADDFSVIVSKGSQLLLAQTFPYSNPADVIYYLLSICHQFSFSQETVQVALSGLVDRQSALYKELYQYFLLVHFREAEWSLPPGEQEYPSHFFTSLNDLVQCAS